MNFISRSDPSPCLQCSRLASDPRNGRRKSRSIIPLAPGTNEIAAAKAHIPG